MADHINDHRGLPDIMSPQGVNPLEEVRPDSEMRRIRVPDRMPQPSPVPVSIRINSDKVDVSEMKNYTSIKPTQDNIIRDSVSPRLNVRSPGRVRSPPKPPRVVKKTVPIHSVRPLDVPPDYIEGPHKIVDRMPKRPPANVRYVARRQPHEEGQIPHPSTISPLREIPDGLDENTVTIEQLQGHARAKRLLLYRRIPVKFNEASLIDWSRFNNEFKAKMYSQIQQKYLTMIHNNSTLLGNTAVYIRQFHTIEDLYSQYIHVKNIIDTQWLRGTIYTGLVLLYTLIGWYLDRFHDMNTGGVIALIIQHGISKELINRLDISPNLTNQAINAGGIPVIWKFIGIILINIFLVYIVCRFFDSESVQSNIGTVSRAVNSMAVEDKIGTDHLIQAGMPLATMIGSKFGLGNIGGLLGGMAKSTPVEDIEDE